MAYVIAEPCIDVKDRACVRVCPVECIYEYEGERMLYINPDECIECGLCEPECPVDAIFHDSEMPEQWKSFIQLNREKTANR
jgi:NAD-dependent dihydropyrimidine dehydrogenase PreA subunit